MNSSLINNDKKRCSECKNEKSLVDFHKNGNTIRSRCKVCVNNKRKQYSGRWKDQKSETRRYIWEYKKSHPCVGCGEADPIVLVFDHIDTETKEFDISKNNGDIELLKKEIDKCSILCSNCHAKRTAKQFKWYQEFLMEEV